MERRRCYIELPKGRVSFRLAEARTLIEHGVLTLPDASGRCEVAGSLDLAGITDEATRGAEYDLQNTLFEDLVNWLELA